MLTAERAYIAVQAAVFFWAVGYRPIGPEDQQTQGCRWPQAQSRMDCGERGIWRLLRSRRTDWVVRAVHRPGGM